MKNRTYLKYNEAKLAVHLLEINSRKEYQARYKERPGLPASPELMYQEWTDWGAFLPPRQLRFVSYAEAKALVQQLGITSSPEYQARYKERPGLPCNPRVIYQEWTGWGAFLPQRQPHLVSYAEAKALVQQLGIASRKEYQARHKERPGLPCNPERIYQEWSDWGAFLLPRQPRFLSYAEAKALVQQLGITSSPEYQARYKERPGLPCNPGVRYQEWTGWDAFLPPRQPRFVSYAEAKALVQQLGITSSPEYQARYKECPGLPASPTGIYQEWSGWGAFLLPRQPRFLSYAEAKTLVQQLGIASFKEYQARYKERPGLPYKPERTYQEWAGWGAFLPPRQPRFVSYAEAKTLVQQLGIASFKEYKARYKERLGLPASPKLIYQEWTDWDAFLPPRQPHFVSYAEAKALVQQLDITSRKEYQARQKERPGLPCNPERIYQEWSDWGAFLPPRQPHFVSYAEAKALVQQLGITSRKEYKARYKERPALPFNPWVRYQEWTGWDAFLPLRQPRFVSYAEAKTLVQQLGITSLKEYKARYKETPGLPCNPWVIYQEWTDWDAFLLPRQPRFVSYAEAKALVQQLGIASLKEYKNCDKHHLGLPTTPKAYYKLDSNDWESFFIPEHIKSIPSLKVACRAIGISDSRQYREARKKYKQLPSHPERLEGWTDYYDLLDIARPYPFETLRGVVKEAKLRTMDEYDKWRVASKDPRVPARPIEVYEGKGWTNTFDFFGQVRPFKVRYFDSDWNVWGGLISEFLKTARGGGTKEKDLCEFVRVFIEKCEYEKDPHQFLTRGKTNIQPMLDVLNQVSVTRKKKWLFSINEFLDWVITKNLSVEDEDTGQVFRINGAKNPFQHINFDGETTTPVVNETNKLSLPYQFVKAGRDWIFPADSIERQLNFRDLSHLQKFGADWVAIDDRFEIDLQDPDCVIKEVNCKRYLWVPIFWVYTYALMHLPARGRQIIYCDSGEADKEFADFWDGKVVWVENKSGIAGQTKSQSMIYKTPDNDIGVRYTSNKTSFNGEGYTIPFMPLELAFWLVKLRKWQHKYNPITRPKSWLELKGTFLNETQRKQKGRNCFLFRDFNDEAPGTFSGRLSQRLAASLFFSAGDELSLAKYNKLNFHQFKLLNIDEPSLSHFQSDFTPHSMRVSLINAYINEFGLPLEVILKLVGHSSIVMTIYYMKSGVGGLHIREKLRRGEKQAALVAVDSIRQFVEQQRIEECRGELIANNQDFLKFLNNDRPVGAYQWKDYGICPVGGNFCKEGGEPVAAKTQIYHPVPAGYLGEQNCLQCRFFVTGPAFMVGLACLFNEISHAVSTQYRRFNNLQIQVQELTEKIEVISHKQYRDKWDAEQSNQMLKEKSAMQEKRRLINSEMETRAKKIDPLVMDMNAIHRLIRVCRNLIDEGKSTEVGQGAYQLIAPKDVSLEACIEEKSWFYQLSEVCENAELFKSCSDELALATRSQAIDRMLQSNDFKPQMMFLTEAEQLIVGNQLTEILLTRLKGWDKLDRLIDNELTFKDLPDDERLTSTDIKQLFASAETIKLKGA
jgi:uncharacterized membrane protein YagU involved in acid resistance